MATIARIDTGDGNVYDIEDTTARNNITSLTTAVNNADLKADDAANAAASAQSTANAAQNTADSAATAASNAASAASAAQNTADSAATAASNAASAASTAQNTANTAKKTADSAKTTADSAKTTADSAKTTANTAKTTADSAKTTADSVANALNNEATANYEDEAFYWDNTQTTTPRYFDDIQIRAIRKVGDMYVAQIFFDGQLTSTPANRIVKVATTHLKPNGTQTFILGTGVGQIISSITLTSAGEMYLYDMDGNDDTFDGVTITIPLQPYKEAPVS